MATNPYADGCALIEGKFFPIAEARIPILDTGFTRSDLTYDVVAVWKGKFFRLDDHLERFENSYTQLRMKPTISLAEIRNQNHEVKIILRQEHLTFGVSRKGSGSP